MDHLELTIEFKGRKPSIRQIMARLKPYIVASPIKGTDHTYAEIVWGENFIQIDYDNDRWHGYGHIKDISADTIAAQLNASPARAFNAAFGDPVSFLREHFTIVKIS